MNVTARMLSVVRIKLVNAVLKNVVANLKAKWPGRFTRLGHFFYNNI